ncbi:hypothetical protein TNCV_2502331 [Trichonephila clavipes]|nr:hypothetical protein TNCV_2502331 [Trichonephila clavipes]
MESSQEPGAIQTFGEDRIVRGTAYPWPLPSFNTDWLCVYLSGPSSLLKDAIHRLSSIHPDMLHSAVAGFVTRLECLLPLWWWSWEHILV